MHHRIFISARFCEASTEAGQLKQTLEAKGISTFLSNVPPGENLSSTIAHALKSCDLVVIMGTATYGKNTDVGFSTYNELKYVCEKKKPFYLIKMCDSFEEPETVLVLHQGISYHRWRPRTPMPPDLVPKIIAKVQDILDWDAKSDVFFDCQ